MSKATLLLEVLALSTIITYQPVVGQANPGYVMYNPNLDVYRKPDLHSLAKVITAQNELAMAKLAHYGMLNSNGLIPTRESANNVLKKLMQDDSPSRDRSLNLKEEKIDTSKVGQRWSDALYRNKDKSRTKSERSLKPDSSKKSNPDQPSVRQKTNKLKTMSVNPILQLSEDIFKKKLGNNIETPSLKKRVASKMAAISQKKTDPELKTLRVNPSVEISKKALESKLDNPNRLVDMDKDKNAPLMKLKEKISKTIDRKISKQKDVFAAVGLKIPDDVYRQKLIGKEMPKERLVVKKSEGDKVDRMDKLPQTLPSAQSKKVANPSLDKKAETLPKQKAVEKNLLKRPPQKSEQSGSSKNKPQTEFDERNPLGMEKRKETAKVLKTIDSPSLTVSVSENAYNQRVDQNITQTWSNKVPASKFIASNSTAPTSNNFKTMDVDKVEKKEESGKKSRRLSKTKERRSASRLARREKGFEKMRRSAMASINKDQIAAGMSRDQFLDRDATALNITGWCPKHWEMQSKFCMRHTRKDEKFRNAVISCLAMDRTAMGPGSRLLTVGKIRKLLTVPDFVHTFKNHAFRVNAYKDYDGFWKEYPSGALVDFTSFPTFNHLWGHHGDTLIWMSRWNSLRVVSNRENHYRAICYREHFGIVTASCGLPPLRECSDHGDCINGACICDVGHSGALCDTAVSGRSGGLRVLPNPSNRKLCKTTCGDGGSCDPSTGQCVCMEGTKFNNSTQSCDCILDSGTSGCYTFGPKGVDYVTAAQHCISKGLRMVEVHNENDQKALENLVKGSMNVWLGADNMGEPGTGYRWHSGIQVSTGDLGGWASEEHPSQEGCLAMSGVIGHTWLTMECSQKKCCGHMTIDTLCRVY